MTCFAQGLTNLQYIRCRTIAMTTSKFYSNFIHYTLVSCFELLARHEHPAFDFIEWVGHGKVCVAWMKMVWPLHQRVTCKPWITKTTSREWGSIVEFKVMLWTMFAFYSHVQLPSSGDTVIKIFKNKGHSWLVMYESGRIWNQKEMKKKIRTANPSVIMKWYLVIDWNFLILFHDLCSSYEIYFFSLKHFACFFLNSISLRPCRKIFGHHRNIAVF